MSFRHLLIGGLVVLLGSACVATTSTTFIEYRGPDMVAGTGGTVRTIAGIDYWETGTPNRNYRILGVIQDARSDKALFTLLKDNEIARVATEHGGDAVFALQNLRQLTDPGQADYRAGIKLAVVKYLP